MKVSPHSLPGLVAAVFFAMVLMPVAHAQVTISELKKQSGLSVSGVVRSVVGNKFVLDDGTGQVIVEAGPRWYQPLNLTEGERIKVVGEYDDGDFDAFSITRASGEVIEIRPSDGPPPWAGGRGEGGERREVTATITGTIRSIIGNEFVLDEGTRQVIVEAEPTPARNLNLAVGERITVFGEQDDEDFDAYTITRASGEVMEIRRRDD